MLRPEATGSHEGPSHVEGFADNGDFLDGVPTECGLDDAFRENEVVFGVTGFPFQQDVLGGDALGLGVGGEEVRLFLLVLLRTVAGDQDLGGSLGSVEIDGAVHGGLEAAAEDAAEIDFCGFVFQEEEVGDGIAGVHETNGPKGLKLSGAWGILTH